MVRGVKQPLKKTVGRSTLDYDELQTAVVEIEAIVNGGLLMYVYDDEESVSTPLSPSHLQKLASQESDLSGLVMSEYFFECHESYDPMTTKLST